MLIGSHVCGRVCAYMIHHHSSTAGGTTLVQTVSNDEEKSQWVRGGFPLAGA